LHRAVDEGQHSGLPAPAAGEVAGDAEETPAQVAGLVGVGKRVLAVGCAPGPLWQLLGQRGCQIVSLARADQAPGPAAEFCERVIRDDLDPFDSGAELGHERFDVIVAAGTLAQLRDPLATLAALRPLLRPEGYLVASLPNIAHLSVRLALLGGEFPSGDPGRPEYARLHHFTRQTLERLCEGAGFAVGRLERVERGPGAAGDDRAAPPGVIEMLSRDPEARAWQFVFTAYPEGRPEFRRFEERLHELILAKADAEGRASELGQEVARLRQTFAEQEGDVRLLEAQVRASPAREVDLRAMLFDAHDQLVRREEEAIRLQRELDTLLSSKAWRLINSYWGWRQRVRQRLGR